MQPQSFFLKQPHEGKLSSYCGYYALCNYLNEELDLINFENCVFEQYREIGLSEDEIEKIVKESGTGMEGIAVKNYAFNESNNVQDGINNGRFMAATERYGGHWLTYILDSSGVWWEYDSWNDCPRPINSNDDLLLLLKNDNMTNIYYINN